MARILIAGGAKKVGAEISKVLAKEGFDLVIHYRTSGKEAVSVAKECRAFGVQAETIQGDFATREGTEKFTKEYLERFHGTYGLVYNIGNYESKGFMETKMQIWEEFFQTNLFAAVSLTRALFPVLSEEKGRIIYTGVAGLNRVRKQFLASPYIASKAALLSLTQSIAHEFAVNGITVNMVSPGSLEETEDLPERASLPMGRLGRFEEVASAISFLLKPSSCYITGQNLEVAGGVGL